MPSRDDPLLQGVRSFFWRHFHNGWMMDGQLLIWSELPETNYASRAGKTAQSYYITVGFSHIEFQIVTSDSYYPRGLKCKGSKTQRKKETKKERKKERKKGRKKERIAFKVVKKWRIVITGFHDFPV